MSIAAIQSDVTATTMRIADIDLEMMTIDLRRQHLSLGLTTIQSDFQTEFAKYNLENSLDSLSDAEKEALKFDWDQFKLDYEVANEKIQAQDKQLEMQRTALQTTREALATHLESAEKRLSKNEEAELKGANA